MHVVTLITRIQQRPMTSQSDALSSQPTISVVRYLEVFADELERQVDISVAVLATRHGELLVDEAVDAVVVRGGGARGSAPRQPTSLSVVVQINAASMFRGVGISCFRQLIVITIIINRGLVLVIVFAAVS